MPTQTDAARPAVTDENPPPANPAPTSQDPLDNQARYAMLRYRTSLGILVAAPALILLPPRKMDIFTFGLGASWVYCLGEVADQHGRDPWRGFKRYEQLNKGKAEGRVAGTNGELVKAGEWKGEKIVRDVRPKEEEQEEEGKSISGIIMQQVWDVWEQKDRDRDRDRKKGKE
ncbi:hypothetical protein B9Z19DRAFT_1098598 [Tuber borchii]|uniref:Uncharacterized protein n=1 Tax=Tuber borchii TaxID=42251 RepID=A0A2T7A766_TUBBO|nr:hypothetical protein B9Z19DRAFT_1098598 [Tuber borchii]